MKRNQMLRKNLFAFLNLMCLSHILRWQKKNTITVLSLHKISCERNYFWNPISPSTFEKLLQYITRYYSVISFSDIASIQKKPAPKPYAILSFDDGYFDFYEYALPLLKKYNLPCNHNIVNECASNNEIIWTERLNSIFNYCKGQGENLCFTITGKEISIEGFNWNWMKFYLNIYNLLLNIPKAERLQVLLEQEEKFKIRPRCTMMNWKQINECAQNLVEIGCHTYSHDSLSTITDEKVLQEEIIYSINEIENKLGKKITILALPNGESNPDITKVLSSSNLKYLLFTGDKINKLVVPGDNQINNIYRINMVEESYAEMVLRMELFHTKMRKYA